MGVPQRRILHIIDLVGPGGAQSVYLDLASRLDPAQWMSVAAVPGEGWLHQALADRSVATRIAPIRKTTFDWRYLHRVASLIRSERIDLVQAHLLGSGVYGVLAGVLTSVPVVVTFHGQVDIAPNERFRRAKFAILNRARRVVLVSNALRTYFLSTTRIRPERTAVIENGIDAPCFHPGGDRHYRGEWGMKAGDFLVGAIGHIRPAKDYETLLRAARILCDEQPGYRFVIVGGVDNQAYYDRLCGLQRELGLERAVTFTGAINDAAAVLPAFDVYALTSSAEGFSLSTVQAQASGVPVVVTKCGGPEEIVEDQVSGLLADVSSPASVAAAIARLRADAQLRARLVQQGLRLASRFSIDRTIDQYASLYAQCVR